MPVLRAIGGPLAGRVFPAPAAGTVLGRNPESCTIVLESAAVSRLHARLICEGDAYYIEDAGSHNGTRVNSRLLPRGRVGRRRLRHGDVIDICGFQFQFEDDAAEESSVVLTRDREGESPQITSAIDVARAAEARLGVKPAAKLQLVLQILEDSARAADLKTLLSKVLDRLFAMFRQAERGFALLREPEGDGRLTTQVAKRRDGTNEQIRFSRTLVDNVLREGTAVLVADADYPEELAVSESIAQLRLRSIMCVPLVGAEGRALGLIELDVTRSGVRFTQEDLDLLAGVARHVAIVIENARLHEEALREQQRRLELERLQRELALAREIQQTFLPESPPPTEGLEFYQFYQPADQVGGDYYDYIALPGDRMAVVVADVVGEGVPAALLMARFAAETRYCLVSEPTPLLALERLNANFARLMQGSKFITLLLAVFHVGDRRVSLLNAGHWPPLLARGGRAAPVESPQRSFPIGLMEDARFHQQEVSLAPGDLLAMFTDGIVDASNAAAQRYGPERLARQLAADEGPARAGARILEDLRAFTAGQKPVDDMCLLLAGWRAGG